MEVKLTRRSARSACLIAGLAVKRSSVIVRVKGIDEPSDNDNTWDNAAEDQKKGRYRSLLWRLRLQAFRYKSIGTFTNCSCL